MNAAPVHRSITAEGGHSKRFAPAAAFTLTELLVVIAILAILAATQLPALTGGKSQTSLAQCMNNLRQIGQAAQLYTTDNNDCYPFTGDHGANWPNLFLPYLGNDTNQPPSYVCPQVTPQEYAQNVAFQFHYQGNRCVLADTGDLARPIRTADIKNHSIYWLIMEGNPSSLYTIRPGGLGTILSAWNVPPGYLGLRRHNGGFAATACDGHVEWLRPPPYRPGAPSPQNFGELGDTSDGANPASSWVDNGLPKKLYCRKYQGAGNVSF